ASVGARWVGREARQRPAKPYTRVRIPYPPRAIGAAVARFPDTEEVTGSIPVSPTSSPGPSRSGALVFPGHFGPLSGGRRRVRSLGVRSVGQRADLTPTGPNTAPVVTQRTEH